MSPKLKGSKICTKNLSAALVKEISSLLINRNGWHTASSVAASTASSVLAWTQRSGRARG
jgi:hypothetical protein